MQPGDNLDEIFRHFRRGIRCEVRGCHWEAERAITRQREEREQEDDGGPLSEAGLRARDRLSDESERTKREQEFERKGREIDVEVARAMFPNLETIEVDEYGARDYYLKDPSARRTGEHSSEARLIGGYWVQHSTGEFYGRLVPLYTRNISDAWQIVHAMQRRGFSVIVDNYPPEEGHPPRVITIVQDNGDTWLGESEAAPEAICLAVLRALGVEPTARLDR